MTSLNKDKLDVLAYWIHERELILNLRRLGQSKPWTADPILQSYRFCNVKREDDKVTKWLAKTWRHEAMWDQPNFLPAMILARTINWPDTLQEIGFPYVWKREVCLDRLNKRQKRGDKVYTGAYMITAGPPGVTKNEWVTQNADVYFNLRPVMFTTLEKTWESLQTYPCVGPFIAGQVIADLKQTSHLEKATDWWTWAGLGPGSTRGLNRLYDREVKAGLRQDQGLAEMREIRLALDRSDLCLQDIQNCLCEFDKYLRVKLGEGKPRSSYPGIK